MNHQTENFIIQSWSEHDVRTVYDMVVLLAHFEKEPDAVITTPEDYLEAFKNGLISGHLAKSEDGNIAGMTLFYETFSTWKGKMLYLEDFFVLQEFRNKGVGDLLFEAYVKEAKIRKCTSLKWQVLDWNDQAVRFYEKRGAEILKDWWTCRVIL
ncbi:MAG: GNAT family N-acetyltransferase [Saprospiraceae bacterium]|nr:GNAT family N-acetyltransferase [Saprospiraceae bacterium]